MAGIYFHVPFCKVKCHYCDFHFSTQLKQKDQMIAAMKAELINRVDYLKNEKINTIYFGGGTPSIIDDHQLANFIELVRQNFQTENTIEITVEANPDDLTLEKLKSYNAFGINRLSIGIQSFDDEVLRFMNRAHSAKEAINCIENSRTAGFDNITVDLIYGIPAKNNDYWLKQVNQFLSFDLPHLSSYCLTIEPKTYFGKKYANGAGLPTDEESLSQFQTLIDVLSEKGYEQYEISNFAKTGYISKHNSSYWLGAPYLGIGPSAHSYNKLQRGWNVANNASYIKNQLNGVTNYETEELTVSDKCNDYILTRLRTKWGIQLSDLDFISRTQMADLKLKLNYFIAKNLIVENQGVFTLSTIGKYRADGIAADLFISN